MKSLRLLLFNECDRSCKLCVNKQHDLSQVPKVVTFAEFNEVILTGGEPLLKPDLVLSTIKRIREENSCPIYMYTAKVNDPLVFLQVLEALDGVTVTLHTKKDVLPFLRINDAIEAQSDIYKNKSLRLSVFRNIEVPVQLSHWIVKKDLVWRKDCPLPENEVFMRL